jgi:hypothetical protein
MVAMVRTEPTLRINIFKRGNPRCSVCGQEFGSEGFTNSLIEAFALHVRRQHMQNEMNAGAARSYANSSSQRTSRAETHRPSTSG